MKGVLDIHRELLARGVAHEVVRLPRVVLAADELPEVLALPATRCLAVRLYEVGDRGATGAPRWRLVAAVVPAGATPAPSALLAGSGGAVLRPAAPDLVNRETEYAASLVSPLLLPDGVDVLVDASCAGDAVVYVPTGESGTAVGLSFADLAAVTGARVANLLTGDDEVTLDLLDASLRAHLPRG